MLGCFGEQVAVRAGEAEAGRSGGRPSPAPRPTGGRWRGDAWAGRGSRHRHAAPWCSCGRLDGAADERLHLDDRARLPGERRKRCQRPSRPSTTRRTDVAGPRVHHGSRSQRRGTGACTIARPRPPGSRGSIRSPSCSGRMPTSHWRDRDQVPGRGAGQPRVLRLAVGRCVAARRSSARTRTARSGGRRRSTSRADGIDPQVVVEGPLAVAGRIARRSSATGSCGRRSPPFSL